ncbi:MAG TPA: hypothetical protein VF040_04775 [Ktedonobacterales bacterium]
MIQDEPLPFTARRLIRPPSVQLPAVTDKPSPNTRYFAPRLLVLQDITGMGRGFCRPLSPSALTVREPRLYTDYVLLLPIPAAPRGSL